MLPLATRIQVEPKPAERRRNARHSLSLPVEGTPGALVENISETGIALTTVATLRPGDTFHIELLVAGLVTARVAWAKDGRVGAEFLAPITHAAVSGARLRGPITPAAAQEDTPVEFLGTRPAAGPRYILAVGVMCACVLVAAMFIAALMTAPYSLS